jgi:N-acetylmuramoyl-L-alanine amidase
VAEASAPVRLAPPSANLGGGFSMARQLGLSVSRIVIDPGHGGHDPGAAGKGLTEAALVLDVALRLEKLLAGVPGVEAILTRRADEFVGLQERTAIANREGADLFLSIHANASANAKAQGVETYFLNFATTGSAAAVAARENAASGQPMAALPDLVKAIAMHNKVDESRDLATYVQAALVRKLGATNKNLKNLGVKQAPFVVLIGASMPSVLAEISFLTNAQDLGMVRNSSYRQRIAESLFDAIRKYQSTLRTESRVAQH